MTSFNVNVIGYLLMHKELCKAYRMLQSGKRHARLNPDELEEIMIKIDIKKLNTDFARMIEEKENEIKQLENKIDINRDEIDDYYSS